MNYLRDFLTRTSGICSIEGDPGTGGGTLPTPPAPPTPDPNAAWYAGADAETLGYLQNRGWDKLDAKGAAFEAGKAHREAERFIGAPAAQLVRIPEATDSVAMKAMWQRLGAPADAAGYDFTTVKRGEAALDQATSDWARTTAAELNLPKDVATRMVAEMVKFQDSTAAAASAERNAKIEGERATLKTNWGANYEANMFVAKQAAAKLGATPEAVAALEGQVGYNSVMEMFRKIGSSLGEDKFVQSLAPGQSGIATREQAIARKAELMADTQWTKRYMDGGSAENRELQGLLTLITGDDTEYSRRA